MKSMFLANFTDAKGDEHTNLYFAFDYPQFFRDTFSPLSEVHNILGFALHGTNYKSRKMQLQGIAIDYSHFNTAGISYNELATITAWFRRNGKRYGLLKEFGENGII